MHDFASALVGNTLGPEALARSGVQDPGGFQGQWASLAAGLPETATQALAEALLSSARPDLALRTLRELRDDPELALDPAAIGLPALARVLGGADFLARRAVRMPDAVREVSAAATLPARLEPEAHARLASLEVGDRLDRVGRELRRNRYHEMFRISARALAGVPGAETTRELSDLADASLSAGLAAVEAAHAVPRSLAVIAMGKLGGRELNFSSDVDLLFAHGEPGAGEERNRALARAVTSFRSLLSETSEEGFVFRVDLDLRPEGRAGPLLNAADTLIDFYESFGRTWERVAWIRARPCAGNRSIADRILHELQPFIYRRYGSYDVIQNIREVKQRIEADARHSDRNVKLGPGGIREAEFVVQGLQALYGGRHETLRTPNTGEALAALEALGILAADAAEGIADAYDFLRRVENAIQIVEDRQVQELPTEPDELRQLARRLGWDDPEGSTAVEGFTRTLDAARDRVRSAFESWLVEREVRTAVRIPESSSWQQACESPHRFAAALVAAADPAVAEKARPAAQRLAEAVFAEALPRAARLAACPESAPALALFLASDAELVSHLIQRPELLEAFRPSDADASPSPLPEGPADDLEAALDRLRLARRDHSVYVAARFLRGEASERELEASLSKAAEGILESGLALARHHDALGRSDDGSTAPARLCVLALGKLGSREMTFHSDLDLVFLYEPREGVEPLLGQEWAARLAQKVIHYLTTPTAAGRAYEVDTRLRPSGHGGTLVASFEAFRHYHERRAQIWEAQALLRARPVAGDPEFGAEVLAGVRSALFEFLKYPGLAGEILRMRARMEEELARTDPGWIDLKTGPGGIVDAEFLAQYLALREGPRRPELRGGSVPELITAAGQLGLLRDAGDVVGCLETLRRAQTSLRLVTGRPDSAFEIDGPTAQRTAAISGATDPEAWIESLRAAQAQLRSIFLREVRPEADPPG